MDKKVLVAIISAIGFIIAAFIGSYNSGSVDSMDNKINVTVPISNNVYNNMTTASASDLAATNTPIPTPTETPAQKSIETQSETLGKSAEDWSNEGDKLYSEGDFSGAVDCYNKAIEINRYNPAYWNAKGYAFKEMGEREQTNDRYEQAKGEYEKAIQAFNEALRLSSKEDFPDAQEGKDYCLEQLKLLS